VAEAEREAGQGVGRASVHRPTPSARFTKVGFPESGCAACHAQAKKNDFVVTKG
jgi:hypothetical protein